MSDSQDARRIAEREANEWHVRLGERPVSAATLETFRLWRRDPVNAEAYQSVETLWRTSSSLSTDPDIVALTQNTLKASRPRHGKTGASRLLPVAGAAVAIAVAVAFVLRPQGDGFTTPVGEQRLVTLADGTQVRLDTDTRLTVRFAGSERRVVLEQGQALFRVAHDAARPFKVTAGDAEVTALGTTFDVRRDAGDVRVTLVEGSVAVTEGKAESGRRWRLSPGQQVDTAAAAPAPRTVDAAVETSWSEGRLIFRDVRLADAVAEVNRYLPDKVVLAAGAFDDRPVNGVFQAGDRDAFVAAVTTLFGLSARREADGGVRLTASSVGG